MNQQSESLQQLCAAIELSRLPSIGAARFKMLIDRYGCPIAAFAQTPQQRHLLNTKGKTILTHEQLNRVIDFAATADFTYYGAPDYPRLLAQLAEPPPYLFRQGPLWPLQTHMVAIVGPRDCSEDGRNFAQTIAAHLAKQGVIIVSGGACGIDAAAHNGALAHGGLSILVTATGIDMVYPPQHQELFEHIRKRGCLLTELLPGTPPRRDFFPTRNRIIVGLSSALIIVEGKLRTGTWSSASHALKQQRKIFVWTESPRPELRTLPLWLLEHGAFGLNTSDPSPIMRII